MTPREEIGYGLDALVIFRSLQQDPVIRALMQFCHTDKENTPAQIRFYSAMVSALYERADDLTGYLEQIVLEHENVYVQRAGAGEPISPNLETCLHTELKLLNRIAMLTPAMIQAEMQTSIPLPAWQTHKTDLDALYTQRVAEIAKHGYGIYARHHMFTVGAGGELVPVQYPDPISLEQMVGYERERSIVVDNTKALLAGKYASNVLLAGDAGTGKSATVKAIANAFKDDGLRLIELNKDQLCYIPQIMDHLCRNPLKFILFIDDLTFSEDDPNFGTLKATWRAALRHGCGTPSSTPPATAATWSKRPSTTAATSTPTTPYRSASLCQSGSASPSPTAGRRKTCIWRSSTLWRNRTVWTSPQKSWTHRQNSSLSRRAAEAPVQQNS